MHLEYWRRLRLVSIAGQLDLGLVIGDVYGMAIRHVATLLDLLGKLGRRHLFGFCKSRFGIGHAAAECEESLAESSLMLEIAYHCRDFLVGTVKNMLK